MTERYNINSIWGKWMSMAIETARNSPDPSTQNGAVLVRGSFSEFANAAGFNRPATGTRMTAERWERPLKYSFVEHAERNAIYDAARRGVKTQGLTMVCVWAACADCARAIVESGIVELVRFATPPNKRWDETIEIADRILLEGGLRITTLGRAIAHEPILRDGEPWQADPSTWKKA